MSSKEISVRVGRDEIGRILNLKENLDHNGLWLQYVSRYQSLGWALVASNARGGADLNLDFSLSPEVWSAKLGELGMEEIQVNVGIRTGSPSRLLVLEVNRGEGALLLDQMGKWRSECVAEVGNSREQHYYALPPERLSPPSFFLAPQVLIYGEGGLVLAPPSIEPQGREPWRWQRPPWENPPQAPTPAVWQFIREHATQVVSRTESGGTEPQVLPWEEIYQIIAPYGQVLKSLLVPAPSLEAYYYGILAAARGVGIRDAATLLGLLWHAPHGDCRQRSGSWEYLQDLVAAAPAPHPTGPEGAGFPHPGAELPAALNSLGAWSFPEKAFTEAGWLPGSPEGDGAATGSGSFDPSVSNKFFQLLAGLGERVIIESCRYEALLSGLGTTAKEMKRRQWEWDQRFCPSLDEAQAPEEVVSQEVQGGSSDITQAWAAMMPPQAQEGRQLQEVQAAAVEFLNQNPDLAADRQQLLMVIFCLKNYVAINPEFATVPFKEKLAKAAKMARVFLWDKGATSLGGTA